MAVLAETMAGAKGGERGVGKTPPRTERQFEMKFLLTEPLLAPIAAWAREHLGADPLARAADGDTYRIHSLYFDTDQLDVYHRTPGFRRSKYRVRRYGAESLLYLEKKSKQNGWVRKQRTSIPDSDLPRLLQEQTEDPWDGDWFRESLARRGLTPVCQVSYVRIARVGVVEDSPVRVTMDREIRCLPAKDLHLRHADAERGAPIERYILELKFRTALPLLFKRLIREYELTPQSSSKYRAAAELTGLVPTGRTQN